MSTMLTQSVTFVSTAEAAKVIGCSESHVRRLLIDGDLKGQKLNARAWAVRLDSAEEYAREPQKMGRPRGSSSGSDS
jgi:excisionase family DNA binding protein